MIGDTENVLHLLYLHKEGTTQSVKHIKNVDGTWGSPVTLFSYTTNLSLYQGQLLIDSQNILHFFPAIGISPINVTEHWIYDGSSWSKDERLSTFVHNPCHDVVIDKRDNFHFIVGSFDYDIARVTNESGSWETKEIISDVPFTGNLRYTNFKYDAGLDRLYFGFASTAQDDVGFVYFDLTPPTYAPSASSTSSASQSSSSSADSKSSESSDSSSLSSSSDSSSSSSIASKSSESSSSESSSSESSSSADSKSSSSESSPSAFTCVEFSGDFTYGQTYTASGYYSPGGDPDAYIPERAFDNDTYTRWWVNDPDNEWIQVDLDRPRAVSRLTISGIAYSNTLTAFELYGSNTGNFTGEETLILSDSGLVFESPSYAISWLTYLNHQFSSYRFVITAWSGAFITVAEISMQECYDIFSSSSESISSSSYSPVSVSSSSESSSSESYPMIALYELCENFNVSSSSSSRSESSLSGPPDFVGPI
jgi:hypothetical protein